MPRKLLLAVAAVLAIATAALAAQERRSVVLEIGMPNGSAPQLRIGEGETGTVSSPELGKYGFVPAVQDGTVIVDVFDLNREPHQRLDRIEAAVGGEPVQSKTEPTFGIRVVRVMTQ